MPGIDLQQEMIDRDKGQWEQQLRASAQSKGVTYDPSDLEGVIRQVSYGANAGKDPLEFIKNQQAIYDQRAAPTSHRPNDSQTTDPIKQAANLTADLQRPGHSIGPGLLPPLQPPPINPNDPRTALSYSGNVSDHPGFQFNDPYTKLYEDVAKKNLESLQGQNTQMQQLMDFLNKQFSTLSTSQGYSPEELAVLQTQALEPIEANRQASQQRVLQRASVRGVLPSSGIVQDEQRMVDTDFDKLRAGASRDVAINSINERRNRLADALNFAQLGVQIPDQRNAQALSVANNLYQIPRNAMMDANSVINGSSPTAALSPLIQLLQLGQQNSQFNQNMDAQQQAAFYNAIGQFLGGLF